MAYITMTSRSANSITVRIRKLSEQTSAYQYFKITCSNGVSEEWHDAYDYGDGVNSGYYTSTDKTFTNLSPSTRYTFTAKAKYLGVWYDVKESAVSSWSFWTESATAPEPEPTPIAPSPPNSPTLQRRTVGGLDLSWNSVLNANGYRLKLTDWAGTTYYPGFTTYTSNTSYSVTGLKHGTKYTCSVMAKGDGGVSSYSSENIVTTAPKAPTLSLSGSTNTSISVNMSNMEGNHTDFYCTISNSSGLVDWKIVSVSSVTFTGLTQGSNYTIRVNSRYLVGSTYITSASSGTLSVSTNSRPSNWSWTTSELNAFNNKGSLSTLTYSRWNSFLDKINEFQVYRGITPTSFSKMTFSNKTLTADRFNAVRYAIGSMYSTGIPTVYTGNIVYGSYFVTLANCLNNII